MSSPTSDVPRYLFRAYSPGSDGCNNARGFASLADLHGYFEVKSLKQLPWAEARSMLNDHVLWQSRKLCRYDDILISFTPSLLFALQHCVRKIHLCYRTTAQNCFICMIDTSKCPPGTFSWTVNLLKQYDLDESDDKRLHHQYHEAEYLAEYQLDLDGESSVEVSFGDLDSLGGLFDIVPELAEPGYKGQLLNRLQQLRQLWYNDEKAVTSEDRDKALRLAVCFGDQWVSAIMMWALAFKSRPQEDQLIKGLIPRWILRLVVVTIPSSLTEPSTGENRTPYLFRDPQTRIPSTLKELVEWEKLMRTAHKAQTCIATPETEHVCGQTEKDSVNDVTGLLEGLAI